MNVQKKIPAAWLYLRPGDQIATRLPLHRIERHVSELEALGIKVETSPSPNGYWLKCVEKPQ